MVTCSLLEREDKTDVARGINTQFPTNLTPRLKTGAFF